MGIFDFYRKEATAAKAETDKLVSEFDKALSAFEVGILDRLATAFDEGLAKTKTERGRIEVQIQAFKDYIRITEASIADFEQELRQTVGADGILKRAQADLIALSDPPEVVQAPFDPPVVAVEPEPAAVVVAVAAE